MRGLVLIILLLMCAPGWSLEFDLLKSSEGNNAVLVANGVLGTRDARTLARILDERAEKGHRTIILLTSPGGILEVVSSLGDTILKASKSLYDKHGKSNIFAVNTECSSACTVLTAYLTSKRNVDALEIVVDGDSLFAIHGPRGGASAQNKQIAAYRAAGVSSEWLARHDRNLRRTVVTPLKARDLCAAGVGILPNESCWDTSVGDLVEDLKGRLGIVYDEP